MISDNLTVDNVIALLVAKLAKEREDNRARITQLEARNEQLQTALKPFAYCRNANGMCPDLQYGECAGCQARAADALDAVKTENERLKARLQEIIDESTGQGHVGARAANIARAALITAAKSGGAR